MREQGSIAEGGEPEMRCKKCKHHAIPLTEGLCYKCASDRLQTLKEYSSTELRDELARRNSEAEQKQAKTEANEKACIQAAKEMGYNEEEALYCDMGTLNCVNCPWTKNKVS